MREVASLVGLVVLSPDSFWRTNDGFYDRRISLLGRYTSARAARMSPRREDHTGRPDGGDGFRSHPPDGPAASDGTRWSSVTKLIMGCPPERRRKRGSWQRAAGSGRATSMESVWRFDTRRFRQCDSLAVQSSERKHAPRVAVTLDASPNIDSHRP